MRALFSRKKNMAGWLSLNMNASRLSERMRPSVFWESFDLVELAKNGVSNDLIIGLQTAESRLVAEGEGEGQMFEDNNSLEEEEDTLLKYGAIAKLITSDSNKSTFL